MPTELISTSATAHRAFDPRTSVFGRRARSTKAAILSTPSTAPVTTMSRRFRWLNSLHLVPATLRILAPVTDDVAFDAAQVPECRLLNPILLPSAPSTSTTALPLRGIGSCRRLAQGVPIPHSGCRRFRRCRGARHHRSEHLAAPGCAGRPDRCRDRIGRRRAEATANDGVVSAPVKSR